MLLLKEGSVLMHRKVNQHKWSFESLSKISELGANNFAGDEDLVDECPHKYSLLSLTEIKAYLLSNEVIRLIFSNLALLNNKESILRCILELLRES
jgi:hypothetical protein